MRYLLDTNVISELRKGPSRMNASCKEWVEAVDINDCFVSVISILELERGVLAKERLDQVQGAVLRAWLEEYVLPAFRATLLPVTLDVARKAALLSVPDPAPYYDALIGATALVNGCTVVTRNGCDFRRFEVPIADPWKG